MFTNLGSDSTSENEQDKHKKYQVEVAIWYLLKVMAEMHTPKYFEIPGVLNLSVKTCCAVVLCKLCFLSRISASDTLFVSTFKARMSIKIAFAFIQLKFFELTSLDDILLILLVYFI